MDILISAIVGDLVSRSASFVISKYFQKQPSIDKILQKLQSVVLRMDIVVEEAEGRHITNQGMLRQLKLLRQGMYRGRYILDAFRFQAALDDVEGEEEMSHTSSALSKFSPAKRPRFSRTRCGSSNREVLLSGINSNMQEELQRMVDTLEDTMAGIKEFLFFLELYPRIHRQPYGAYLILDNCMFGRQTEREHVLNFLLHPSDTPDLAVLPIVGPIRVGKSTLVEYVCRDEGVRNRFSMILFFPEGTLKDERVTDLKGNNISDLVRHQNCAAQSRLLIIVEIGDDINEDTWRSLKYSAACMAPCGGSKIIITSRSDRIANLGTTKALRLDFLPPEAYWHFFKSLVFGSSNPDDKPKLATIAMEMALEQKQCFTIAHIIAGILRDNFNSQFWCKILECMRAYKQTHFLMSDKHPNLSLQEDEPVWRLARSSKYFLVCDYHQSDSSRKVPKISFRDILLGCGRTLPRGKFEALEWRSRIPPYYNYTMTCEVEAPKSMADRKKRVSRDEGRLFE
ncbi:unnamed protein product [Alopecurus aequalis]